MRNRVRAAGRETHERSVIPSAQGWPHLKRLHSEPIHRDHGDVSAWIEGDRPARECATIRGLDNGLFDAAHNVGVSDQTVWRDRE